MVLEDYKQYGKCAITGIELGKNDWHCHHKEPYHLSKDDRYANLIVLHESVYRSYFVMGV